MPTVSGTVTDKSGNTAPWSVDWTIAGQTPTGPPLGVPGVNVNSPEPAYFTDWRASRCYRQSGTNGLVATFNKTQPEIIGVTDDPNWPRTGGQATADKVRAMLEEFYYGSGSAARLGCWVNVANGNEVTNEYETGTLPASVVDTWRLMHDAVHTLNTDGTRRFPKASMGIDVTTWTITQGTAGPRFKPVAQYCDYVAASLYPPGREADPVVWSPYGDYVDAVLAMMIDWRATANPDLSRFAIWETGSPIDHATDAGGPNNLGTTNWTIRPRYFAGGQASTGTTYEGLLNYVWRRFAVESGFQVNELIYWNEQSNPDIPNPFKHDRQPLASPDMVTAWHNWTPGSTLPPG